MAVLIHVHLVPDQEMAASVTDLINVDFVLGQGMATLIHVDFVLGQ